MPSFDRDGVRLHYEDHGVGVPVLFHTGGGGDHRMWEQAGYPSYFPGYRLLLMDHRGHGASDQPVALEAHRPQEYVDDVLAILDHAGASAAVLVGYSGGADTLYRVAAQQPQRTLALIALGNAPLPDDDNAARMSMAAAVRAKGMRGLMEEFSAEESEAAPAWLVDNLATTTEEMFALPLEAAVNTPTLWDVVPVITSPVLLICGQDEVEPDEFTAAANRLAAAESHLLDGYGHLQAFWHAEVVAPMMVDWLDRIGVRQ
jgi:pimeloyl-ACP methyl ester carboxylesterase